MTGFGIYVHWPFCTKKCPYCDFNSHVRTRFDETAWIDSIVAELSWVRRAQGEAAPVVDTVFFGGGTPSLMSGHAVGRVMEAIADLWPVATAVEITLEANPASAEAGRFADYRAAGVNRLSLGVQALNDTDLKFLGRLHDANEAKQALAIACTTFAHVSLDLIYARPEQTLAQWRAELAEALSYETEHLSLYQLTIEPQTPFATLAQLGQLTVPDEDRAAALYELTQEMTEACGRPAYEVSNHARSGRECRHNLICWRYGDYAGVGPGAHGRLMLEGRRVATASERIPERWQTRVSEHGHGYVERAMVDTRDAAREHLLMNLRLCEGIDLAAYRARWDVEIARDAIAELEESELVELSHGRLRVTPAGRLLLNTVIARLSL